MLPSYKGGINSDPNFKNTGTVTPRADKSKITVSFLWTNVQLKIFLWALFKNLVAKWSSNALGFTLRKNIIIRAGTSVTESTAAKKIVNICVAAIGLKSL